MEYEDFLERFRDADAAGADGDAGAADGMADEEVCRALLQHAANIHSAFDAIDANKDGFLSLDELHGALGDMGVALSRARAQRLLAGMDLDGDGKVNYREFVRKVSRVAMSDVERQRWDLAGAGGGACARAAPRALRRREAGVPPPPPPRAGAMPPPSSPHPPCLRRPPSHAERPTPPGRAQAFHYLDADADGRLSRAEFAQGLAALGLVPEAVAGGGEKEEARLARHALRPRGLVRAPPPPCLGGREGVN